MKISINSILNNKQSLIISNPQVILEFSEPPKKFYRHGWHSWSLASWIDPSKPPIQVSSTLLGGKDEDPLYTRSSKHISAWVGIIELSDEQCILVGALDLGGRIEFNEFNMRAFYENGFGDWVVIHGNEGQVFKEYSAMLKKRFIMSDSNWMGWKFRHDHIPRVWCSWYSLYNWVNEKSFLSAVEGLADLPFDVVQIDDGWERGIGDWQENMKFPSGMKYIAKRIRASGRIPGIWLAPFMATLQSDLARQHPDWLLRDEKDSLVKAGLSWNGITYALDSSHPDVLDWVENQIRRVLDWGYEYLKLDFLYTGSLPGKRRLNIPREEAYRLALQRIRTASGNAYILGCAGPIIPSLGLCDGMRIGPDVAPYWVNTPMSRWLNNPAHPGAQNALRSSLNRLWLQPLVHTDPDVVFFRHRNNALTEIQQSALIDLCRISLFKSSSDIPAWLTPVERQTLRNFLSENPKITQTGRYRYKIGDHEVDFSQLITIAKPVSFPVNLATALGIIDMAVHEVLPAVFESFRHRKE